MSSEPQVRAVRHAADAVEIDLHVSASLDFFPDHFPRLGILPGVVQIDWALSLGRQHLPVDGAFLGLRSIKFVNPILPGADLTLSVSRPARNELAFAYRAGARTFSSGRALFGLRA
ncbi:MAG TPA: thioester dehydrase [Verrucomicrobiae bacterium]|nr:thioester dehydrase [Verrucomicrobiae bacterium]